MQHIFKKKGAFRDWVVVSKRVLDTSPNFNNIVGNKERVSFSGTYMDGSDVQVVFREDSDGIIVGVRASEKAIADFEKAAYDIVGKEIWGSFEVYKEADIEDILSNRPTTVQTDEFIFYVKGPMPGWIKLSKQFLDNDSKFVDIVPNAQDKSFSGTFKDTNTPFKLMFNGDSEKTGIKVSGDSNAIEQFEYGMMGVAQGYWGGKQYSNVDLSGSIAFNEFNNIEEQKPEPESLTNDDLLAEVQKNKKEVMYEPSIEEEDSTTKQPSKKKKISLIIAIVGLVAVLGFIVYFVLNTFVFNKQTPTATSNQVTTQDDPVNLQSGDAQHKSVYSDIATKIIMDTTGIDLTAQKDKWAFSKYEDKSTTGNIIGSLTDDAGNKYLVIFYIDPSDSTLYNPHMAQQNGVTIFDDGFLEINTGADTNTTTETPTTEQATEQATPVQ